jgi:hypothetical protein
MLKDSDIRLALKNNTSKTNNPLHYIIKKDNSTVVVDELSVNNANARADVVAINGELHCFEIKSDVDTFKRLENQMQNYLRIFDRINFVTTEKHITNLSNRLPDCAGIYILRKKNHNISFEKIRSNQNNANIEKYSVFNLLWNIEMKFLVKKAGIKGYTKMNNNEVCDAIIDKITFKDLRYCIRSLLKIRSEKINWKVNQTKELYDEYAQFLSTPLMHQSFLPHLALQ